MNATIVDCIWPAACELGEGPVWDPVRERLWFVDIKRRLLLGCDETGGARSEAFLPELTSAVALIEGARDLLAACPSGLYRLDPDTGARALLCPLEPERPANRPNDGKVDPWGRFWIGTMRDAEDGRAEGALYRFDPGAGLTRFIDHVGIANGLDWRPDRRVMYFTDSLSGEIVEIPFDAETPRCKDLTFFAETIRLPGAPDGLTVDSGGHIWSARWDGAMIARFAPDGLLDATLPVPVPRPTSVAFGGRDGMTLFITSARLGLDAAALAAHPLSGGLFACRPGVSGQPSRAVRLD